MYLLQNYGKTIIQIAKKAENFNSYTNFYQLAINPDAVYGEGQCK
jgi:hypothetical protein